MRESAIEAGATDIDRHLGDLIGDRYAIVGYLGRGGMGVVYRARDIKADGEVALKVLLSQQPSKRAMRRFLREAKVAVRLRHPNIVTTHGFGRVEDSFFLAMEIVDGQPLSKYWRRGIPFEALVAIAMQSVNALGAAHEAGVIHRDLKPGNILITRNERGGLLVKIVDFGLARPFLPQSGCEFVALKDVPTGTIAYMAPEQLRCLPPGPAMDVYAVGHILAELLLGHTPYQRMTASQVVEAKLGVDRHPFESPILEGPLGSVVAQAVANDPRHRYRSAEAMLTDIMSQSSKVPVSRSTVAA